MNDATLQIKLQQFVKLGNELHAEAIRRYGKEGQMFHEAGGSVCIMTSDSDSALERNEYIVFSAPGARWGMGAF